MRVVIIGAGPAGVTVAETIRRFDADVELVVLSGEPYPPYSPPAMIDHFLTGSDVHLWRGPDWADRTGIDYRSGTSVTTVDPGERRLCLSNGQDLTWHRLVVASGGRLYAPIEGAELPGVYNFKSLSAAESLVGRVRSGQASSAVIVGAGFIGMEIALLLAHLGLEVTQVEQLDQVMSGTLHAETAAFALDAMRRRGVDVRLETRARAFLGDTHAEGVELESGDVLRGDLYVAATGIRPTVDFLDGSGIEIRWGITVDDRLRTTAPDVFACGDCVEAIDRLTGAPFVHAILPNAVEQAACVGLNVLGHGRRYLGAERMNSLKHLDLPIVAVGLKEGDAVLRAARHGALRLLFLREHRLVGFQLVGDTRGAGVLRTLINRGDEVRGLEHRLLDPGFGQGMIVSGALPAKGSFLKC